MCSESALLFPEWSGSGVGQRGWAYIRMDSLRRGNEAELHCPGLKRS